MRAVSSNRCLVFLLLALAGCAIDLATKSWMFKSLGMPGPESHIWWIWKGFFGFQTSLNEGALFGFGQGMVPLFAGLSIVAAIGICFWLFFGGAGRDWLLSIALGCVMAGIFGNLYDRLGLPGLIWNGLHGPHAVGEPVYAVRDFILVMIGKWHWPNFNVADSLLVCGAALLVWHALRVKSHPKQEPNC
ncbi:MAG TPA: signal peptidase II [Thermoguttaceae bacterium]